MNYELFKLKQKQELLHQKKEIGFFLRNFSKKKRTTSYYIELEQINYKIMTLEKAIERIKDNELGEIVAIPDSKSTLKCLTEDSLDLSIEKMKADSQLEHLVINTRFLLMQENIFISMSEQLLSNADTLYRGLKNSNNDVRIIQTEHFEIIVNRLLEIKLKKMTEADCLREEEIVENIIKVIKNILETRIKI